MGRVMKVALEKLTAGADGKLVSQVARRRLAGASAAFRFSSVDGLLLIPPPPVESALLATGVSADGSTAVGWKRDAPSPGQYEAIRWRAAAGTIGLGVLAGSRIRFSRASSASIDGNVIVGYGLNPSRVPEGWVAVIPEPSNHLLLASGLALLTLPGGGGRKPDRTRVARVARLNATRSLPCTRPR
jgi:hypothetical protein